MSRAATTMLFFAHAALTTACAGGSASRPDDASRTIHVAPAPPGTARASSEGPEPGGGASLDARSAPTLSIGNGEVCARIGGRLHCTKTLDPQTPLASSPAIAGLDDVVDVTHGDAFACVVAHRGEVWCWGSNEWGQIGAGSRADRIEAPTRVVGITGARRVFAGSQHACAIVADGRVVCWGSNDTGQTGSATFYLPPARELVVPTPVDGVRDAVVIAAGRSSTCALTTNKVGFCWGAPVFTQAKKYDLNDKPAPTLPLARFEDLSANRGGWCGAHEGNVRCFGELTMLVDHPVGAREGTVEGVRDAKRVRAAGSHACALLGDGGVVCWGMSYAGALGRAEKSASYDRQPADRVAGLPPAAEVVVGGEMSCAIGRDRQIWCWGTFPSTAPGPRRKEMTPVLMAR